MTQDQVKRLEKLERILAEATALVRELKADRGTPKTTETEKDDSFDSAGFLARMRTLERSVAESELSQLKQHELGAIFALAGGASGDKRKPKAWLIEQILWRAFDFERGHDTIRKEFDKRS